MSEHMFIEHGLSFFATFWGRFWSCSFSVVDFLGSLACVIQLASSALHVNHQLHRRLLVFMKWQILRHLLFVCLFV